MVLVSTFVVACAVWCVAAFACQTITIAAAFVQPARRRASARNDDQPHISVLVPVTESHAGFEAALESVYAQSYPEFEVIISAADASASAIPVARRIAARYPAAKTRFVLEAASVAVSPKLNNLVIPLAMANHNLIFEKDSNIRLEIGQLAEIVRHRAPGVGLVVAAPIASDPANFAAEIECALMNGYQCRLLFAASLLGFDVGTGGLLLFDRRDLERAGGVQAIAKFINEDHALAKALARIGLRTAFSAKPVRQILGHRGLADIWNRQLRWMVCRRQTELWAFLVEPVYFGLLAATTAAIGASLWSLPAMPVFATALLIWLALEAALVRIKGWGWSWRWPAAALCREVLLVALWFKSWRTREIVWGDKVLEVRRGGPAIDRQGSAPLH